MILPSRPTGKEERWGAHSCLLASDPLWSLFSLSTSLSNPFYLWPWEPFQRESQLSCRRLQLSSSSPCSSALDAIQEALQLLESVRPEAQAEDQLLDDKAQALLWLYICTLEAKLQEVRVVVWG